MKFSILLSILAVGFAISTSPPGKFSLVTSIEIQIEKTPNSFSEFFSNPTQEYSTIFKKAFSNYRQKAVRNNLKYSNNAFKSFAYEFARLLVTRLYGETTATSHNDLVKHLLSRETCLLKDLINRLLEDQNLCKELVSLYRNPLKFRGDLIDDFQLKVIVCSLKNIPIMDLDLGDNELTDITPLASLTTLQFLDLSNSPREVRKNRIVDFSPLASLVALKSLNLANNQIDDLASLSSSLPNLLIVKLENNLITNISSLASLRNLSHLDLRNNQIVDISSLASLLKLEILYLSNNPIANIAPVASLRNLGILHLSYIGITNISILATLSKLTVLNLNNNRITDISPLATLPKISSLYLSDNLITDISTLRSLRDLKRLHISNNLIRDFSILDSFRFFIDLETQGNQVDYVHSSTRI